MAMNTPGLGIEVGGKIGNPASFALELMWIGTGATNGCVRFSFSWKYNFLEITFYHTEGGASSNPCSDIFAGNSPFSEIEAKSFSEFITGIPNLLIHLAFHCYGHMLMLPYGYTKEHLDNHDEALAVAASAVRKLAEKYGTQYTYGNIAETICKNYT